MKSLRGRLTLALVVTLTAVFALQWVLVSLSIRRIVENQMAARLAHDVESLLADVKLDSGGRLSLNPPMTSLVFHQPYSGHYYRIQSGQTVLRSRSLWDTDLAVPPVAAGDTVRLHRSGPAGQPLLVLAQGFTKQGRHLTIAVAEDLAPVQADIGRFQQAYLALTLVLLAVLIALQRYSVGRALRPLAGVRMDLRQLARGETERIGEDVPAEVRPLVREVNHLLDLLARRLDQSRTALGNLAHALKTPLTLLVRLAEDPHTQASPELRERLTAHTSAIRSLIERELKRAQLAGRGGSGARFRPARELPSLVAILERMYAAKALDIRCTVAPETVFNADHQDMLELIGNLADNACKWAHQRVELRLEEDDGLRLSVEDDGPGLQPGEAEQLGRRGVRLDESTEGHGLGLAIVRDIVDLYGGRLAFARSPTLGGLAVQVWLPAPQDDG